MLLTMWRCCPDIGLLESKQMNKPSDLPYRVYVLRLWRAEAHGLSWRASLENPRTNERLGFENLERLFAFLMEQTECDANLKQGETNEQRTCSR
jgi:hypothetical protein